MTGKDLAKDLSLATWATPNVNADADKQSSATVGIPKNTQPIIAFARNVSQWATLRSALSGLDYAIENRPESGGTSLPTQASGQIAFGCLARTEKFAVRLMILSAWLMAYPWSYLKHWERKGDRRRRTASRTEAS
jgi:hypothetical protein